MLLGTEIAQFVHLTEYSYLLAVLFESKHSIDSNTHTIRRSVVVVLDDSDTLIVGYLVSHRNSLIS